MTQDKKNTATCKKHKSINSFWYYINKVIKQIRTFILFGLLTTVLLSHSNLKQCKEIRS